jgi:hypothetical protein
MGDLKPAVVLVDDIGRRVPLNPKPGKPVSW